MKQIADEMRISQANNKIFLIPCRQISLQVHSSHTNDEKHAQLSKEMVSLFFFSTTCSVDCTCYAITIATGVLNSKV